MNEETQEEIVRLLRENVRLSKKIQASVEKTEKYIFWMKVLNFIKVLLIAIPLVLALIYLPPAVQKLAATYQDIFSTVDNLKSGNLDASDVHLLKTLLP